MPATTGAGAAQPGAPADPPAEPAKPAKDTPRARPPAEEDADLALQHARALQTIQQRDQELTQLRAQVKDVAKTAKWKSDLEKRAKDPAEVLDVLQELTGYTFNDLARAIAEDVVKPPKGARYANLPPEVAERMEALEKRDKEREEREQQRAMQDQFRTDTGTVASYLKENAEDFPLLSALEWAPQAVVQSAYQQQKLNEGVRIAVDMERAQRANLERLLSSDTVLDAVLGSNETLRARLAARFSGQPVVSNGHGSEAPNGGAPPVPRSTEQPLVGRDTRSDAEIDAYARSELAKRRAARAQQ